LGSLFFSLGRVAEAEEEFQKSQRVVGPLVKLAPKNMEYQEEREYSLLYLGRVFETGGHLAEAEDCFGKAVAVQEEMFRLHPSDNEMRRELVRGLCYHSGVIGAMGRQALADAGFHRAERLVEGLIQIDPSAHIYGLYLAMCRRGLGQLNEQTGRRAQAEIVGVWLVEVDPEAALRWFSAAAAQEGRVEDGEELRSQNVHRRTPLVR
jgi:tetratricopeptide (TPR) repeat protein